MRADGPRLRDLGIWSSGGTPPKDRSELWDGDVPWVSGKDFEDTRLRAPVDHITAHAAHAYSAVMPAGSIVALVRGMALVHGLPVALVPEDVAINQDVRGVVLRPEYEARFVHYALLAIRRRLAAHIDRAAHGTARFVESGYAERLPDPRAVDQLAVVDFLDRECDRIDEVRRCAAHVTDHVGSFEEALLDEVMTRAGTEFGARRLMLLTDPRRPIMYGIVLPGPDVADGVLLVKGGDVDSGGLAPKLLSRTAVEIEAPYRRARLRAGDVLVTIRGSYGAVAEVPVALEGANITQDTARVSVGPDVSSRWLVHALRSAGIARAIAKRATGATIRGVNIRDLKRVEVPVPTRAVQDALTRELDEAEARARSLRDRVEAFDARLSEYRDALIAEAVTGQLDVARLSDAQLDESAHAALEGETPEVLAS